MARNKSEKRSPVDQAVFDYIKAWVEHSCTESGQPYYKEGMVHSSFGWGPGEKQWQRLSDRGRALCHRIPHTARREWLRAQKQK